MDVKIVFKTIDAVLSRRDIGCRGVDAPEDFDEYRKRIWNERSTVTGRIDLASSKEG
jgi:hypothetical protein